MWFLFPRKIWIFPAKKIVSNYPAVVLRGRLPEEDVSGEEFADPGIKVSIYRKWVNYYFIILVTFKVKNENKVESGRFKILFPEKFIFVAVVTIDFNHYRPFFCNFQKESQTRQNKLSTIGSPAWSFGRPPTVSWTFEGETN